MGARKQTNVLITGGAGFIGSHIADEALRQKCSVIVVDDLSNGRIENVPKDTILCNLSILNDGFQKAVQEFMPHVIFHEAAQPSLRRSIEEPAFDAEVNILGTIRVIEAARISRP